MIGYAICGSFCTHKASLAVLKKISEKEDIITILSNEAYSTDTRFGKSEDLIRNAEEISGKKTIHTIKDAEPFGPEVNLDSLIIAPCTGNTLAKIAHGITDTPVTMAAKAHLRCDRPLVIALASNDSMSANLENIALLLNRKGIYFVPMIQDDPQKKPHSLVADFNLIEKTLESAKKMRQIRPLFLTKD